MGTVPIMTDNSMRWWLYWGSLCMVALLVAGGLGWGIGLAASPVQGQRTHLLVIDLHGLER